jgi:hypothetical protein
VVVARAWRTITGWPARLRATGKDDHLPLLDQLPVLTPTDDDSLGKELEQLRLPPNLLFLAQIDHQHEYELCRSVAERLLGRSLRPRESGGERS